MKVVSVALLVCVYAVTMAQADDKPREYNLDKAPELFETFVKDYNRVYKDEADRKEHYEAFVDALKRINESNKSNPAATYGINKLADFTDAEKRNLFGVRTKKP